MLQIDGSMGEGGGQVLRTSLALSALTGTPFRITRVRAGRARPGLMRQHLACVQGAADITGADVEGAEIGSTELTFRPGAVRAGDRSFALGGAGSTTLVFQTVLYPLLLAAKAPSVLRFEGGTHNPMAPPIEFIVSSFLPLLAKMGARLELSFERHGFYPAGGGAWSITVHPVEQLGGLELLARGAIRDRRALAIVAQIRGEVATRELDTLCTKLSWPREHGHPRGASDSLGPGNVLFAFVETEHVTEVVTGFGERGVKAELVAAKVADDMARYLASDVPVGEHLADQLLLPLALGAGGSFRTLPLSLHARTQIDVIVTFLGDRVRIEETREETGAVRIDVRTGG